LRGLTRRVSCLFLFVQAVTRRLWNIQESKVRPKGAKFNEHKWVSYDER
jgi:hypothetical protein